MRLLISCMLVAASFALPQHSFFTVQGHGSNAARIKAHLERSNLPENVPISSKIASHQPQKNEVHASTIQPTSTPATKTQRQPAKVIQSKIQPISIPIKRVQPQVTRTFGQRVKPSSSLRTIQSQITGVLQPEKQSISKTLFSGAILEILPEISEFTERLDNIDGTSPAEFVSAVSDLTHSFVEARAKDEGREVTEEEENTVKLTEVAFDITLGLIKDISEADDITSTMKKITDIVPRLANIVATVEGRELTKYEIEDLKNANEMVSSLSPFFSKFVNLDFKLGRSGSGKESLSNANADFIQDYATQNLRNIQDFTKSNSQNFRDYHNLQSNQFSSNREQEYFRNNVRRVQEFSRNNRKNVESLPARLSPNGGSFGEISGQVEDIIKDTQQILDGELVKLPSNSNRFQ